MPTTNTYTTASGWTVTVKPEEGTTTYKLCAVSADRRRVIHRDRLSEPRAMSFDPAAEWGGPR